MSEQIYLASYGQGGFLGRFRSITLHERGERVVARTARGLEISSILGTGSASGPPIEGEILRAATSEDDATERLLRDESSALVMSAQQLAESLHLPLMFLDGEILLDRRTAVLQAVHWDDCEATTLFETLSEQHGLHVQLADLTTTPKKATGCSTCGAEKSGCDSCGTGGGCSTGSCSKGAVKSAEELTSYFAGLRKQMEASNVRIPIG